MRATLLRRRYVAVLAAMASGIVLTHSAGATGATGASVAVPAALAAPTCDAASMPETTPTDGRVPASDYPTRAAQGYTCNTSAAGHYGKTGGFKTLRYVDPAGHVCAYYDS